MLRASRKALYMFSLKELQHFHLHPKDRWQTSCSLADKRVCIWHPISHLIIYMESEQDFSWMIESLGSFITVLFSTAIEWDSAMGSTGKHRTALKNKTVLVEGILDSWVFWLAAWGILQNFRHSSIPCLNGYIPLKGKICPDTEYGYFYVGTIISPLEELFAPYTI